MRLEFMFYAREIVEYVAGLLKNPSTLSPALHFPAMSAFREAALLQELLWKDSTM